MATRRGGNEFLALVGWTLRFHRARNPEARRKARARVVELVGRRWRRYQGWSPEREVPVRAVEAMWRGASLAARSRLQTWLSRIYPRFLGSLLLWFVGRANVLGVLTAYLCWQWTRVEEPAAPAELGLWSSGGSGQPV
ncbi:MAG: hypothetical protein OWV35_08235 [Firmicutes bacterium]|nr:hypothetical protein [Bacillota bacterium]